MTPRVPSRCSLVLLLAAAGGVFAQPLPPPGEPLLPLSALPAYEQDIDHAGLIRGWNKASLARGQAIYQAVCHNCHGDLNLPGSLPNALRFASGKFQHGSDPHSLYRTITQGWRLMPPQVHLVPQEKYDVIHYIRETFLASHNATQLFAVTPDYLAGLPRGESRGPAPTVRAPWREMDYGPLLIGTFELADAAQRSAAAALPSNRADFVPPDANIAYKGIALQLDAAAGGVAAGRAWAIFEHDTLRFAGAWTGEGFIDWHGINFDGRHVVRPRTVGELHARLPDGPGWADPRTGRFADARVLGVDGRRFGPLPREWARFRGLFRDGPRTVISYSVGQASVLEAYELEERENTPVFVRILNISRSPHDLTLRVAAADTAVALTVDDNAERLALARDAEFVTLHIPARATPRKLALRYARHESPTLTDFARRASPPRDLSATLRGGAPRWPESITTQTLASEATGAFMWERLTLPTTNPWRARVRPSGFDFLPGGDAAVVCTWDGDVWRVEGLASARGELKWRRIAAGLFQPLGLKVRGADIFVTCRDQLVALRDLNGDGEADFYECINSDHQVTEHFHEFAMGLQMDAAGNFYYAKSARHARTALVPQHGTLLKIAADGSRTEILANGFRAANGVCLNPDGSFFVTDQEGHWMPANRINHVTPRGGFFGNMWSYDAPSDASDSAMAPPLCWIDKGLDRSPAELVWLRGPSWRALDGALLNLSYGRGLLELVLQDRSGIAQAAVVPLPIPEFPTGIMRGRVHPTTEQLYLCGLSAWATSQTLQEGGFYRVRPTSAPLLMPTEWRVLPDGFELTLSEPLDPSVTRDLARFELKTWSLKRTENYGSPRLDVKSIAVTRAELLEPRKLRLHLPSLAPAAGFELRLRLRSTAGETFDRTLHGTLHALPDSR